MEVDTTMIKALLWLNHQGASFKLAPWWLGQYVSNYWLRGSNWQFLPLGKIKLPVLFSSHLLPTCRLSSVPVSPFRVPSCVVLAVYSYNTCRSLCLTHNVDGSSDKTYKVSEDDYITGSCFQSPHSLYLWSDLATSWDWPTHLLGLTYSPPGTDLVTW